MTSPAPTAILFQRDDAGYVAWRAASPGGWVANVHQGLGGIYFKVHRATCSKTEDLTHAKHAQPLTGGNYAKLVAPDLITLCAWRVARGLDLPADAMCALCSPGVSLPDAFEPSADRDRLTAAARLLRAAPELVRPRGAAHPTVTHGASATYATSAVVHEWVTRRAAGCCELCSAPAPFVLPTGEPFLEVHHLHRLADGGADTPENCAALCPNCHRRVHLSADAAAVTAALRTKVVARDRSLPESLPRSAT